MLTTNFKDIFSLLNIIFILSLNILSNVHSFTPESRGGHMATLVNDKIYFFGGSRPIPITSSEWNQTHQYNLSDEGTTVLGNGALRIFLVGGVQQNMKTFGYNTTNSSLWIYNINSQHWDTSGPGTYGPSLPRRRSTATVIDKNGVIYIFGGRVEVDTGSDVFTIFDDFLTFDTLLLKWSNLTNHPSKRSHTTATLMPDGKIIYIGGVTQSAPGEDAIRISMNDIYIFDTLDSTWSQKSALGDNIEPRLGHTALLDVKYEPFQYLSPQPSGIAPPPLAFHTATLYHNYMIVAFGNITNDSGSPTNTSSDVYLMNLLNYTWVTRFEKISPSNSTTTIDIKLISIIGGIVIFSGACIGIIVCFKHYKRRTNKNNKEENIIISKQILVIEQPH
ncbi:galactose oxidase [Gigaspora margarita]|uniref:Galactose oxidase n=1 Tax=Gigaspora margarita TaxID=4874 RepID=A0A8H3XDF9_GIGMA|nr:galactose oxidase [Gigaspora margarita]